MGRASLFDAFQAATGATQTVLNSLDKEYRAQAAIEVQNAQLENAEAFDRFLMDIQNSGDWENYEKDWEVFKAKAYNAGAKNLTSPYARKIYDSQYKDAEIKQRLTVRHAADQKRRLETVTNGYALVNRMVNSTAYVDKEIVLEDGSVYTKSSGEQKVEDIQKTLLNMYEGGLIDYAQLNQHMKEGAANVMFTDMVNAGKAAVDDMDNLETVLAKVGSYKGTYTSVAGDTVTQDMVMDKAKASVAGYFSEKQQLRWKESEQGASQIYAQMLPLLSQGDFDGAVLMAQKGLEYIQQRDAQYKGDGLSASLRDEYTQKFSIFDNIRQTGKKGIYGAYAKMKKDDVVDYLHVLRVNGITITDKDGKTRTEHFSAKELVEHFRDEVIPKMIAADPENEPLIQAEWGGALFKFADTLLKAPYAPAGVADYVSNLDTTIENTVRLKIGNKKAQTPEGKAQIQYTQALVKAQIASQAAEFTTKDGRLNVDGLKTVVNNAIDSVFVKEMKSNSNDKTVVENASAYGNTKKEDPFGSNIGTGKGEERGGRLLNIALDRVAKFENISVGEAGDKYNKTIQDGGSVLITDKDNKPVYSVRITQDKKGKEIYDVLPIEKTEGGRLRAVQPEKSSKEVAKATQKFQNRAASINLYNDVEGGYNAVKFKDSFLKKVEKIAPENQDLFLEAIQETESEIKKKAESGEDTFTTSQIKKVQDRIWALYEQKVRGKER
jgi:hypothetical protein|nr:MAG TPA: hypothetical protein [Bacteriophage sp.]